MTELMSFEEFLKENEKTAKTYAKQYIEAEYRRKYREEARKKNPDLKKNQLNKMTVSAVEAFKKSPDWYITTSIAKRWRHLMNTKG